MPSSTSSPKLEANLMMTRRRSRARATFVMSAQGISTGLPGLMLADAGGA